MSITRAIQLNTAALAVMGAVFLGLGHRSSFLPLALAVAAIVAVIVGEWFPWLRLNRVVANLIALGAVVWSLKDFFSPTTDDQLLAIANMLIYLQVVLLFQEKSARVYWQLVVLSLLQVVVAAALSLGFYFAVLLVVYIVLALSALVLLCAYRDVRRDAAEGPPGADRISRPWQVLLLPPEVAAGGLSDSEVSLAFRPGMVLRLVGGLAGATLVFTAVFFYATPRLTEGAWSSAQRRSGAGSGLGETMQIEERGQIQLSNHLVMRVSLTNLLDDKPVSLIGYPYFHGFVLGNYVADERGSRWTASEPPGPPFSRPPSMSLTQRHFVRQDIVMEEPDPAALFTILPFHRLPEWQGIDYDRVGHRIRRRQNQGVQFGREFRFAAATTAVRDGRQLHGLPNPNHLRSYGDAEYLEAELEALRWWDAERFPGLAQTAAQVVREADVESGTELEKALALEKHFLLLDSYRYSLDLNFVRDERLDPIEDFVVNHRTGHCEYFASALAIMLRSQGIPARIVVGYKGGDFNPLGRYYVVQKRHAHAWVEAWTPVGMVEESELAGQPSPGGAWYRLDPTPAARDAGDAGEAETLVRRIEHTFDYVDLMWRDYVLSLTADRQQGAFYDPVLSRAAAVSWLESRNTRRWMRQWSERLGLAGVLPNQRVGPRQSFSNRVAVLAVLVAVALFALAKLSLIAGYYARKWFRARRKAVTVERRAPAFYLRLERLLARLPLKRAAGQTPRELAAAAEQRLAGANGQPHSGQGDAAQPQVAHVPGEIVEAYYRVRFGGARLDKNESQAIEQALASLAPAVSLAQKR